MDDEIIQLCTMDGKPAGTAPRKECHRNPALIQMVVHLLIFNSKGEIYLQRRSLTKDSHPGEWDTSVGGHVAGGETLASALKREAKEEIGINLVEADFLFSLLNKSSNETELAFIYKTVYEGAFKIDNVEVMDGRFFSIKEIEAHLESNFFTPCFETVFKMLYPPSC